MKKEVLKKLTEEWTRATERAAEPQPQEQELADQELKQTAAFIVKTGIKGGPLGITIRMSCVASCRC